MKEMLIRLLKKFIADLVKKAQEKPYQTFVAIIAFVVAVPALGQYLLSTYGLITFASYVFSCVYGFTKIVDNPYRPLIWGVGFAVGAVATDTISTTFLPTIKGGDSVSIFAGLVILSVIVMMYARSNQLKNL